MKNIVILVTLVAGLIAIYNFIFPPTQPPEIVVISVPPPIPDTTIQYSPINLVSIEELKSRQHVYGLGENATVDFRIKDELELPYVFNVSWLHNGTRYGWFNESNRTRQFYSYYNVNEKGTWRTQVVLKYTYQNQTYSKDMLTEFEVL